MSFIEIDTVVKDYGSFVALREISLDVDEGEFVSLLGPSGCGKTSLLRSIAGLEDVQGGRISVKGRELSRAGYTMPPERRNVGLVFQSYALWPHMTVAKNIGYGLKLRGWKKADIPGRISEVLDVVGLQGLESRLPAQLSGGQMQRVAVARSIAATPSVLLFDEPLSNLDAKLRESMRFELRQIQKRLGTTAVYVTHDQAEAMVISDRIVLMNHGQIVQQGTARELYETPANAFAAKFLGFSNMLDARIEDVDAVDGIATYRLEDSGARVFGRFRAGMTVGDRVTLSIRPESVDVRQANHSDKGSGPRAVLTATVKDIVYGGNICDVFFDLKGTRLRAQLVPSDCNRLSLDEPVEISIDAVTVWPVPEASDDQPVVDESDTPAVDEVNTEGVSAPFSPSM